MANDVDVSIGLRMESLSRDITAAKQQIKSLDINTNVPQIQEILGGTKGKQGLIDMQKEMDKLNKTVKGATSSVYYWAIGLMFFGITLKSLFDSIWKQSSKVFDDVRHSVWNTVTGFDMLNGSVDYLKFALGAALEPIAAYLAPIIMAIADWAMQHEKLVQWILVTIGVVGTLALGAGALALYINSIVKAFEALMAVATWSRWSTIVTQIGTISAAVWGAITATTAWIAEMALIVWDKIVLGTVAVWEFAAAAWAANAPFIPIELAVIALIALAITFSTAWKQVLEGYKLKFEWVWTFIQEFALWMAKWIAEGQILMSNFGLNVKITFIKIYDGIRAGFVSVVNDMITGIQRVINSVANSRIGKFLGLGAIDLTSYKMSYTPTSISPEDQKSLDNQASQLKDLNDTYQEMAYSIRMARWELEKLMEANQNLGLDNIKKSWEDVFNMVKGQQPGLSVTTPTVNAENSYLANPAPVTNTDNSVTNYDISVVQQPGESAESVINRMLAKIQQISTAKVK